MSNLPLPTRYEDKRAFMARCMASSRVLGASRSNLLDAMERAATDGPTLLTGFAPTPEGDRRSICELLWEQQRMRFLAEAMLQGVPDEEEEEGGGIGHRLGYGGHVLSYGGDAVGYA